MSAAYSAFLTCGLPWPTTSDVLADRSKVGIARAGWRAHLVRFKLSLSAAELLGLLLQLGEAGAVLRVASVERALFEGPQAHEGSSCAGQLRKGSTGALST